LLRRKHKRFHLETDADLQENNNDVTYVYEEISTSSIWSWTEKQTVQWVT